MSDRPKVQFKDCPAPWDGNYCIEGWEEFDRWCELNIPAWQKTNQHCRHIRGVTEEDRMRLLAVVMTEQYLELQKQHLEILKRAMFPPVVLNPT